MLGDNHLRVGDPARPRPGDADADADHRVDIDLVAAEAAGAVAGAEPVAAAVDRATRGDARVRVDRALAIVRVAAPAPGRRGYRTCKRALDLAFAPLLLLASLPLIAVLALIVKCDSRGPVIFRQTRVGANGRLFTFYKFRTMFVDARERFPSLYAYDYGVDELRHMFFKLADDPRCTRVGRLLRRTSLDELPNLLNVVKGDMSLVGPRPEIPEMLPHYRPDQLAKFAVAPGLTGLAQISGRNLLTFQQTAAQDLEYVQRRSFRLDLYILLRTPVIVVQMIGAL